MAYAPESSLSPRRLTAIALVVLLHIAILVALKEGLHRDVMKMIKEPLDVKIIEEEIVPDREPPPPPPKIETPPPFVPPPEINIVLPPEPVQTITTTQVKPPPTVAPPPRAQPVSRTAPMAGRGGLSEPEYPPVSRRLGQEGTVTLLLYIREDGRVGDAKVQESSGFPKLDEAAVDHARRNWRFVPGKENGKPIAMWHPFKVTFKLEN